MSTITNEHGHRTGTNGMHRQFTEMSTPVSWGAAWHTFATEYQLVSLLGVAGLRFYMRPYGNTEWVGVEVVAPERFTGGGHVRDRSHWLATVRRFIATAQDGGWE